METTHNNVGKCKLPWAIVTSQSDAGSVTWSYVGVCDQMGVALKLLANLHEKANFVDEGIKTNSRSKVVTAVKQFFKVVNRKTLVSVMLPDQYRVTREVAGPRFNLVDFKQADVQMCLKTLPCEKAEDVDRRTSWTQRGLIGRSVPSSGRP